MIKLVHSIISYEPARTSPSDLVAMVHQRGCGIAQGPRGNIRFLGTDGVANCVALAVVKDNGPDAPPTVYVGHVDARTDVASSIEQIQDRFGAELNPETDRAYLKTAYMDEQIVFACRMALLSKGIKPITDFRKESGSALVIDLQTGKPVWEEGVYSLHKFQLTGNARHERVMAAIRTRKREPLLLEVDLRTGHTINGFGFETTLRNSTVPALGFDFA